MTPTLWTKTKFDLIAALVVSLVAIPLCLGIALASGAPMYAGIISGVIGGVVVGGLSGSSVNVAGPAAGLTVIVFAAITELGSFESFLCALFIAGLLQIVYAACRAGFIADYFPSHVIQGLLAAVGILIILKELPFAFTLSSSSNDLKTELLDLSRVISYQPLMDLIRHFNPGAIILSFSSIFLLTLIERAKRPWIKSLPGPFMVVLMGVIINELWLNNASILAQNGLQLASLPNHHLKEFFNQIQSPDWSSLLNPQVYVVAFLLSSAAALENLLNIKASEQMDKLHRPNALNRELLAQGIGNSLAGLLGGLPIITLIVRTSINIQNGARSKLATILHGLFILLASTFIPQALNKIPLASLAGILIVTGFKLTAPSLYRKIYRQGPQRFIPFLVTVIGIIYFNLLIGTISGLICSLLFILKSNSQMRMDIIQEKYPQGIVYRLILPQQISFLNKASLLGELNAVPQGSELMIDASQCNYIDKEIIEFLKDYQTNIAGLKKISLSLTGFKEAYTIHDEINFIQVTTYDVQAHLTPPEILNILKEGNQRFYNDISIHRYVKTNIEQTAETQHPIAVVLGCIDSRVPVETVFDMSFGDLFCARVAGNVVNEDILASIEYACHVIGTKLIVILGHSNCGAIKAACDGVKQGFITQLLAKINPALDAEQLCSEDRNGSNPHFVNRIAHLNIANTIVNIYHQSPILKTLIDTGQIGIVGALYDLNSGLVNFSDYSVTIKELKAKDAEVLLQSINQIRNQANKLAKNPH